MTQPKQARHFPSQDEKPCPPAPAVSGEGWMRVPVYDGIDDAMTAIYRRFKDWSERGFGADDVTWCEVKADILSIIARHAPAASTPAPAVAEEVVRHALLSAKGALLDTIKYPGSHCAESSARAALEFIKDALASPAPPVEGE